MDKDIGCIMKRGAVRTIVARAWTIHSWRHLVYLLQHIDVLGVQVDGL